MQFIHTFLTNLIDLASAVASLILSRWLLELSSPEKDLRWLRRQGWFEWLQALRWYRWPEYRYQLAFQRLARRECK